MLHLLYHKNTEKKIKDTKAPTKKPFVFVMNKLVFPLRTTDWFRSVLTLTGGTSPMLH